MPSSRRLLPILLLLLAPQVARADEVMSLERLLLPPALADRLDGSGVDSRSIADGGGHMCMDLASLRLNFNDRVAVHGGWGMAHRRSRGSGLASSGDAFEAGLTLNLLSGHGFVVSLDVTAARARVAGMRFTDETVFLAVHDRI